MAEPFFLVDARGVAEIVRVGQELLGAGDSDLDGLRLVISGVGRDD